MGDITINPAQFIAPATAQNRAQSTPPPRPPPRRGIPPPPPPPPPRPPLPHPPPPLPPVPRPRRSARVPDESAKSLDQPLPLLARPQGAVLPLVQDPHRRLARRRRRLPPHPRRPPPRQHGRLPNLRQRRARSIPRLRRRRFRRCRPSAFPARATRRHDHVPAP